jgi:hypothetical protein
MACMAFSKYLPFYGTEDPPQDGIAKKEREMRKAACHNHLPQ